MSYVTDRYANFENDERRYGLHTLPYLMNDTATNNQNYTWAYPSTLSSYNNVKSGNYNRRSCWPCQNARSVAVQDHGIYPLHPAPAPHYPQVPIEYQKDANRRYEIYQKVRMCNNPNSCGSYTAPGYSNYHDRTHYDLYVLQDTSGRSSYISLSCNKNTRFFL